jgi:hypothetical protein
MAFKFNPFTGTLDQTGSGGGASYIDGEVQNFSALPETIGTPAVDSAYLVREAEGTWLLARKPAGIYIRTADTGVRAADWTHAGAFPDVFNDANFLLYDNSDSTKNLAFQLSGLTTGTVRTLTAPDASGTIALTSDFASPPAIGSTTPNSAAFTTLTANNGTLTASAPVLDLAQTWNNAGVTFTGLRVNVTNTASGSSSLLADFQVNGTSVLEVNSRGLTKVRKVSNITEYVNIFEVFKASSSFFQIRDDGNYTFPSVKGGALATYKTVAKSGGFFLASGGQLGWTSSATDGYNIATDLSIVRDAADTLAQRRDANPQTFRIYNTYTSATNFERLNLRWASNELIIDAEAGGAGGTLRGIKLGSASTSLLGFFGATPVVQQAAVADATDAATAITQLNDLLAAMRTLGLIAT